MKSRLHLLAFGILCLNLSVCAQGGPSGAAPAGPRFGGALDKLFGTNQSFSATLELQMQGPSAEGTLIMPGKLAFDSGRSRFEMDMAQAQGGRMSAEAAAQMKQMGLDRVVMIGRPDQKLAYMIYPEMRAYVENAMSDSQSSTALADFKEKSTDWGQDTVDGHSCVKRKVVVTGPNGNRHVSTVWDATDLRNFPVKIETADRGHKVTMLYKYINFTKPNAALFNPPLHYTKYDNMQEMVKAMIMKRMGGALPPASH